jgi:RNA polymerase sigma-70 factor (ECF subfamily)
MLLALMPPLAPSSVGAPLAKEAAALRPIVRAVIASILREPPSHPDVEDATSETLRRALEKLDDVRAAREARAYVLGIARHVALDALRARKRARAHDEAVTERPSEGRGVELIDDGPDPFERVAEARRAELLRNVMESLPEGQRRALTMFHLDGLEYQEIAKRLEVPLGTVATWVNRGRKALAASLEEAMDR